MVFQLSPEGQTALGAGCFGGRKACAAGGTLDRRSLFIKYRLSRTQVIITQTCCPVIILYQYLAGTIYIADSDLQLEIRAASALAAAGRFPRQD